MDYTFRVIFDFTRMIVCFILLFGWLAPRFLKYAGRQSGIDRIIYSWVGLGGLLITGVFVLVLLNLYDFISLAFILLTLPLFVSAYKQKRNGKSIGKIFTEAENHFLYLQVRFFEGIRNLSPKELRDRFFKKPELKFFRNPYSVFALVLATSASMVRIMPAVRNASPFSRSWFFELEAVKNLSLQQYFEAFPVPKGMHSLVNIFSTLTQVSPEMILHIMGSLVSFFLAIIIFWVIRDMTEGRYQFAALFGTAVYAIFPTLFLPLTLDLEIESSSLNLALCFAIPTTTFFIRNLRSEDKTPWFYITTGIIATGLINLFVLLVILLPFMVLGLISIRKKRYFANLWKIAFYLFVVFLSVLTPFILHCLLNGIPLGTFFQDQFFNTRIYSYSPNLIMDITELSQVYIVLGGLLLIAYITRFFIRKEERLGDEVVFLSLFCLVSYIYTPFFEYSYVIIDPDQLNSFYSLLIAIFGGLLVFSFFRFLDYLFQLPERYLRYAGISTTALLSIGIIVLQGGILVSRMLPQTLPNGFFRSYYEIISERVPYSYATVGPEIDRTLSKNRHYFMNYSFFLDNYGAIDSLYHQYLTVPAEQREIEEVPPASIFLFVEKPPYGSIQQGILYDSPTIMRDMEQWVNSFSNMENRDIRVYFESPNTKVYEIVNREEESDINSVLLNMYSEEKSRASKIFE